MDAGYIRRSYTEVIEWMPVISGARNERVNKVVVGTTNLLSVCVKNNGTFS